jgi:sulfite reductase alpha subunit-like flavoprotein
LAVSSNSNSNNNNTEEPGNNNISLLRPYQAGDIATILPSNSPDQVERFIQTLSDTLIASVDQVLELQYTHNKKKKDDDNQATFGSAFPHWPRRCTLRGWLTYCADIHALPEREDLRALAPFCSPNHHMYQAQHNKLLSLSETSASALYVDYILREKRCWTDVLYDFDSLRDAGSMLTIEALLTLLPPIRPRDFSIASSPTEQLLLWRQQQQQQQHKQHAKNCFLVELCVAVVQGKTPLGRAYHGLCSHYLSELANNSIVRMWIRPGSFSGLPLAPAKTPQHENQWFENPVLCIGAGTGVAPLRSLLLEREAVRTQHVKNSSSINATSVASLDRFDNILVFGCRKRGVDYYYQEEWRQLHDSGRLFALPAFSQEQARKVYVQRLIKENGDAIVKHILENDGAIYIAGNPSMARYSKEELIEATARALGGDEKKANLLFKKLQARGRFSVEAWS